MGIGMGWDGNVEKDVVGIRLGMVGWDEMRWDGVGLRLGLG